MRQVFFDCGNVVVKNVSQPALDEHSILVAVYYSFMSPTMEHAALGLSGNGLFQGISKKIQRALHAKNESQLKSDVYALGYSCSGRVIATGKNVRKFRIGDWVACAGAGYANHADMVSVPENLVVRVSDKQFLKHASLSAVGAVALQSVRRAKLQFGDTVCIIGLDLFGQLAAQIARLSGATVIGIDADEKKLELAKSFGIEHALHIEHDRVVNDILLLTEQHGSDATIITGQLANHSELDYAIELTRKKGRIVLSHDASLQLDRQRLHQREIDMLISCSCGPGRHDPDYEQHGHDYPYAYVRWTENRNMQAFLRKIEAHALSVDAFVQTEIHVTDLKRMNAHLKKEESLGLVLRYVSDTGAVHESVQSAPSIYAENDKKTPAIGLFKPAQRATIRVGVVGTQWDLKKDLVPRVAQVRNVSVDAIVDEDRAVSVGIAQHYGVARTCSYNELFEQEDGVDAVVISSAHNYHAKQILHALHKGRAVFVQKPLVTDFEQLNQMSAFLCAYPHAPLCIDYSRAFSPFFEKILTAIQYKKAPLVMHYRVNKGFMPKDVGIHTDFAAGRIIGDACHIIDLFCHMAACQPIKVSVEALYTARDDLFPTDNFIASISFEDGSICSLTYTTLGHNESGSERIEIFFDGKSIVVDDFVGLYGFGLPSWFNDTTNTPDYGKKVLMKTFFKELKKPLFTPPIPFERLLLSTKLTLLIDQLACEGGGSKSIG